MPSNLTATLLFFLCIFQIACHSNSDVDPQQNACLYAAVESNNSAQVDSCLRLGGDPNLRDEFGATLLHVAVRQGNSQIVEQLLQADADPDLRRQDHYFSTPLMETVVVNDVESAKALIEHDANLMLRDSFGDMALHWAVFYGKTELAHLFLENGADVLAESKQGNILEIALRNQDQFMLASLSSDLAAVPFPVEDLLKRPLRIGETHFGVPLISLAAAKGDVTFLKKTAADLQMLDAVGQSLLSYAAKNNRMNVIEWALLEGVSPNLGDPEEGLFPLSFATENGNVIITKSLLDAGAKIDSPRRFTGYSPLMLAVKNGHVNVAKLLLEAGADINARGLDGATISDMLSFSPNQAMSELLQAHLFRQ